MKVLITGAKGFVGRNLCAALEAVRDGQDRRADHALADLVLYPYDVTNGPEELEAWCAECDFVFNLAGVNRPKDEGEFMAGNFGFASTLLETLKRHGNTCPVMLASSIQASLTGRYAGSAYGESKKAGEELFFRYGRETGAEVLVYRFPNLFGKWCRPNYNSVVATFCHNTAHGLPIRVDDPGAALDLVYIDDVVEELIRALRGQAAREGAWCVVPVHHETTLGHVAETIRSFPRLREGLEVPDLSDSLTRDLYATYLSCLPASGAVRDLEMKEDARGSFTELIRTPDRGQLSVNISKPGVTKGRHWHHTKNEEFIVVKGEALIRQRRIGTQADGSPYPVEEHRVSGRRLQAVAMLPGHTHEIVNLSETEDLVTVMWASEPFDPERPDTFSQEV